MRSVRLSDEVLHELEKFRVYDAETVDDLARRVFKLPLSDRLIARLMKLTMSQAKSMSLSKYPFDMMKVGQTVFVPWELTNTRGNVYAALNRYRKISGKEFSHEASSAGLKVCRLA